MRPYAPLLVCLALLACRDEQAGPHRRQAPALTTGTSAGAGRVLDRLDQPLTFRSGARFANGTVIYLGSRVQPATVKPGETVTITHYFVALKPPPDGYRFFEHLVDARTGQMVLNADHEIQAGALPLGKWPVRKLIEDISTVTIPQGVPPALRVMLGFWNDSGRLDVTPPQAQDGTGRAIGPLIAVEGESLPEYHAKRTHHPPKIDGLLDEPAWKDATPVTLVNSYDGTPTHVRTVARVLYDDKFLYVAFDCEDPDVWGTLLKRDDPIYNEEVVEIFLDANADLATYNELEVSPHGTIFDAYFPARRQGMDTSWDSGMTRAVHVDGTIDDPSDTDKGWSVEMKIPFDRLAKVPHLPPHPGDRWRFNLYRLEHLQRKQIEGQAFSPLYQGDFHNLPRFGWLVFD